MRGFWENWKKEQKSFNLTPKLSKTVTFWVNSDVRRDPPTCSLYMFLRSFLNLGQLSNKQFCHCALIFWIIAIPITSFHQNWNWIENKMATPKKRSSWVAKTPYMTDSTSATCTTLLRKCGRTKPPTLLRHSSKKRRFRASSKPRNGKSVTTVT